MTIIMGRGACSERFGMTIYYKNMKLNCGSWQEGFQYLPIEISIGFYIGGRVGFNFGELVDFLGGFLGFDPMEDDYDESGNLPKMDWWKEKNVSFPVTINEKNSFKPTPQNQNWESKLDAIDEKFNKRLEKKSK